MNNTYVNITGKLSSGLVELYTDINKYAKELAIDFLVVGAMARDLVLVHGYGSKIERGTRDVDFAVNVASWDEFIALRDRLLKAGYQLDAHKIHRLHFKDKDDLPWEIDIVPFGDIADTDKNIHWPPEQDFVMNVHGFSEAFVHALNIQISKEPDIVIPVASPAGVCLLKLVSWLDREVELKPKDATDFEYLIHSYSNIPEIHDALYEQGYMEIQEWDEIKASAMKLGDDASKVASKETMIFLETELFSQPKIVEQFIRDMERNTHKSLSQCGEYFAIFSNAVRS